MIKKMYSTGKGVISMKVTIRDVAKEAGVSPSTVSRVLSNNERISQETKQKVKEAIKKLNFKPNAIARSLANNKTQTLGIILPNEIENTFANPFFSKNLAFSI